MSQGSLNNLFTNQSTYGIPGTGPNNSAGQFPVTTYGGYQGIQDQGQFLPFIPAGQVSVSQTDPNLIGPDGQGANPTYSATPGANSSLSNYLGILNSGQLNNNTQVNYSLQNGYYVPTGQVSHDPNSGFGNQVIDPLIEAGTLAGAGAVGGAAAGLWGASSAAGDSGLAGTTAGGSGMSQGSLDNLLSQYGSSGGAFPGMDPSYGSISAGDLSSPVANAGGYSSGISGYGGGGASSGTNWGSIGNGVQQLLGPQGLGGLYNTWKGNQLNQTTANNLMAMYGNAGAMAQPSVNQVNQTIQNPNSYFSSPLYQSQAALYGNNVDAQKNAAGTAGNGIDYTQKMMGFAGQNYNNYVNTIGNQAQGFLGNQAKYGADYAYGQGLSALSQGASQANLASGVLNNGGNILGSLGSMYSGINGLTGGSLGNALGSAFGSVF